MIQRLQQFVGVPTPGIQNKKVNAYRLRYIRQ